MKKKSIKILAIETSCDETSASLCEAKFKSQNLNIKNLENINILSNIISSQIKIHAKYGGVFPEIASREHLKAILPVVEKAICYKPCAINQKYKAYGLQLKAKIDYIAVTAGPGLIGSLLVGVETAKTLSYLNNIPLYPIHHLEGHIYSNFVRENSSFKNQSSKLPKFPLVCLAVSGGHTSLVYMKNHLDYEIIGETLDDAAGEAFDKVAQLLGSGYPGGPAISALSHKAISYKNLFLKLKTSEQGERLGLTALKFPRPMINSDDFDFSFSGLKTSVLYTIKKLPKPLSKKTKASICKEFQDAVAETLIAKTLKAAKKYRAGSVLLCGGVASNDLLRKMLQAACCKLHVDFFVPAKNLCTDNAAMIGIAAAYKIALGKRPTPWYNVNAYSNSKLI